MKFWDIQSIRNALRDANLRAVSLKIGVHENTLYNLMNRNEKSINYETYKKIVLYLEARNSEKVDENEASQEA